MDNGTKLINKDGNSISLQVSTLGVIPLTNFEPGFKFLVKNLTDSNITMEIRPAEMLEYVETVIYPGWNPEICAGVKFSGTLGELQYGY